jgi:four helix bundle protein
MENINEFSNNQEKPLRSKTFDFALRVIKLGKYLNEEKREYILSKQLLRSGTNPGAMIREAENAESPNDFIHKLSIAQKEISESIYWLELMNKSDYLTDAEFNSINNDAIEILKMLISSIKTKKKNLQNPKKTKSKI